MEYAKRFDGLGVLEFIDVMAMDYGISLNRREAEEVIAMYYCDDDFAQFSERDSILKIVMLRSMEIQYDE